MAKKNKPAAKQHGNAKQAIQQKPGAKKKDSFLPLLLLAAAIAGLCFLPMLKNGFTNWDDDSYVLSNAMLHGPLWADIFTKPVASNYHPLTVLSLAFNYAVSGTEAWSYLLLNLLLHTANTALVFLFIYKISEGKKITAFFAALVFGIHPMHVESVAWISERKDVLYTFFFLLSLLQYWRYLQQGRQFQLWLCFAFFVLSLLSKPAAIVLPLILFLLDYWKQRSFSKNILLEKIPFFLAAVVLSVVTIKVQSTTAMAGLDVYPLWMRLFFACYGIMMYCLLFFVPYHLSAFHPFPLPGSLGWQVYASPLFVLALLFVLWRFRKNKTVVFGLLFFLLNLLLVLQLVSVGYTIISERYTYVPYIGIAFLLATLAEKYQTPQMKKPLLAGAVILFSVFALLIYQQIQVWSNSGTLWTNVIKENPTVPLPYAKRAEYIYRIATGENPGDTAALMRNVIDDCNAAMANDAGAIQQLNTNQQRSLYYIRGISYYYLKENEKAFSDFNYYLNFSPGNTKILYYRAILLMNYFKKYEDAISDFTKAISISPQAMYYLNRSICYYNLGDMANAKADATAAIQHGAAVPENYLQLLNLRP